MASSSGTSLSFDQRNHLSPQWHDRLSRLISRGRKATALTFLEQTIERSLPLFRADRAIFESRRMAWLIRTQLLLEWNRPAEALAWTCLECQLSDAPKDAKALRDRLLRQLDLDFEPAETAPNSIAVESQWPGVAGMYELKARLERDVILGLRYPEEARRYGVSLPNGILLYGPPGCGKTFVARKIAEKLGFNFLEIAPGDLASIYVHGGQEKIKETFAKAAELAPAVLFFDEFDALVPNRDTAGTHYGSEVNEFLVRLNDCAARKILVIAATNHPQRLDPAVLRPGRLDHHFLVGLPDFAARAELFKEHLKGCPCGAMKWNDLAAESAGYTAADVALITEQARRIALEERITTGRETLVCTEHLRAAMKEHPPHVREEEHTQIGFQPPSSGSRGR